MVSAVRRTPRRYVSSPPLHTFLRDFRIACPNATSDAIDIAKDAHSEGRSVACAVDRWIEYANEVAEANADAIADAGACAFVTAIGLTTGELRKAFSPLRDGLVRRVIPYLDTHHYVHGWNRDHPETFVLRILIPANEYPGPVETYDQRLDRLGCKPIGARNGFNPVDDVTGLLMGGPDGRRWVIGDRSIEVAGGGD